LWGFYGQGRGIFVLFSTVFWNQKNAKKDSAYNQHTSDDEAYFFVSFQPIQHKILLLYKARQARGNSCLPYFRVLFNQK